MGNIRVIDSMVALNNLIAEDLFDYFYSKQSQTLSYYTKAKPHTQSKVVKISLDAFNILVQRLNPKEDK